MKQLDFSGPFLDALYISAVLLLMLIVLPMSPDGSQYPEKLIVYWKYWQMELSCLTGLACWAYSRDGYRWALWKVCNPVDASKYPVFSTTPWQKMSVVYLSYQVLHHQIGAIFITSQWFYPTQVANSMIKETYQMPRFSWDVKYFISWQRIVVVMPIDKNVKLQSKEGSLTILARAIYHAV